MNINGMEWRNIGPFRGGRAVAVTGHPTEQMTFYFGCAGGVWKTDDGGPIGKIFQTNSLKHQL